MELKHNRAAFDNHMAEGGGVLTTPESAHDPHDGRPLPHMPGRPGTSALPSQPEQGLLPVTEEGDGRGWSWRIDRLASPGGPHACPAHARMKGERVSMGMKSKLLGERAPTTRPWQLKHPHDTEAVMGLGGRRWASQDRQAAADPQAEERTASTGPTQPRG